MYFVEIQIIELIMEHSSKSVPVLVNLSPRMAPPYVSGNVAQSTRPSSHMWRVWA